VYTDIPLTSNEDSKDVVLNKKTYVFSIRENFKIEKLPCISDYELR
jgi:hypothetical protein